MHIRTVPHFTLLGIVFDYKMQWRHHIAEVTASCSRLKNLFSIIAKTRYGPSIRTLVTLFKSLVQSKIDYGSIAYGAASKTSTPIEVLYAETGTTPFRQRRSWLAANYLLKLSHNTNNSVYPSIFKLFHNPIDWPARSVPCVFYDLQTLKRLNLNLFTTHPEDIRPVMTSVIQRLN